MIRLMFLLLSVLAFHVNAQTFPNRPIKIVVGFPPGGSGDFLTRLAADEMQKALGVPVIADNKPGAGGNIAAETVAKAAPDGYTVLNSPHHAINLALYKNAGYTEKHFAAVTKIATGPAVIVVNNNVPVKDLKELLAYAKANPEKLFNAQAGYGSTPHMAAVVFESVSGVRFTPVQFKGGGPAAQSVIAGDTQIAFSTAPTVIGFIKAGRLRALAVSMRDGSPSVPGIPGTREAGLPEYDYTFWFGLYVPAGTPRAVIARLHEAAAKGLAKAEVREKLAVQGMDPTPSASPEQFEADIRAEAPSIERQIRESGAKVE